MKTSELRQKNNQELTQLLEERTARQAELRFDLAGGKTKSLKEIRSIKLDIARINTLLRQAQK